VNTALLALPLTFALAQAGQQPPPTTKMVLKGKAPVSSEVLKVKLPRPQEADLPNGLHLIVLEDHRIPQVNFQIIVRGAGGYYDPADKVGLATYTASLMREGTKTRTSRPSNSSRIDTRRSSVIRSSTPLASAKMPSINFTGLPGRIPAGSPSAT